MQHESIQQLLARAIIMNEIENNLAFAYKFSDPDGLRTGKSGYSFGRCQFDILNNGRAIQCLQECGFTPDDLQRLKRQDGAIDDLNAKLKARAATVDQYDFSEITHVCDWVKCITQARGISFASDEAFVHACDYHNQFGMQANGKAITRLAALKRPVKPEDIRLYKLTTIWGKKRPDDVLRRYNNIVKIFKA